MTAKPTGFLPWSSLNANMVFNTLGPLVRIQILMQRQPKHRTPSVPRNDHSREEIHPNPLPLLYVLFGYFLPVRDPVLVPPEEGGGAMNAGHFGVLCFGLSPGKTRRFMWRPLFPTEKVRFYPRKGPWLFYRKHTKRYPRTASADGNLRPGTRKYRCRPRDRKPDAGRLYNGEHRRVETKKESVQGQIHEGKGITKKFRTSAVSQLGEPSLLLVG